MLSGRQNSSYAKSTAYTYILINIERMSKYSVTIRGLRVVTTCWSWAWSDRTFPSKWVGLGSPLAACSVFGDLTCSVHTVINLCMFNCQCHFYLYNWGPYVRLAFLPNMLSSWNKHIIIIIIYSHEHGMHSIPLHIKTDVTDVLLKRLLVTRWCHTSARLTLFWPVDHAIFINWSSPLFI